MIEAKGVKSNSEKWHKLYNVTTLKQFLATHADKISWVNPNLDVYQQINTWVSTHLPKFDNDYATPLYEYEEIQRHQRHNPQRETEKTRAIAALRGFNRSQINAMIEERLAYVMSRVKVLETHFVSGISGTNKRTQATPRKDEFAVIAIDIVLRYPEHHFVFANPQQLESSSKDQHHLQQNYIMGFVFTDIQSNLSLEITHDWHGNLMDVIATLDAAAGVDESDMQIDECSSGEHDDD